MRAGCPTGGFRNAERAGSVVKVGTLWYGTNFDLLNVVVEEIVDARC